MTSKMTVYFKSLRKHKPNQGDNITLLNGRQHYFTKWLS